MRLAFWQRGITLIELSPAVWAGVLNKCRYVQIELEGKG
jgi:hypothetical protein